MVAGEAHSKFEVQISYCGRQCVLPQCAAQAAPNQNARKGEMLFWLDKHGIWYSSSMTKAELYDLIKMHKPQYETFAIDCLLAEHGHRLIRLSPYHPDLNPIKRIWGIAKTRIAEKMLL